MSADDDWSKPHSNDGYEMFPESIEEIASGSTCRCAACDRSGDLTLKFVVRRGAFDTQEIVGRTELIGSAIVVAHRLLENSVPVREHAPVTTPLAGIAEASGLGRNFAPDDIDEFYFQDAESYLDESVDED